VNRISVVGSSGSGKTRMAGLIAASLDIPHLELDSVYHQRNWTPLPDVEFLARASSFAEQERWVVDGNYTSSGVLDAMWKRADTVLWLDPSKATVMWQGATRALLRGLAGTELWNGNRERLRNLLRPEPEENVLLWSWTHFERIRTKYENRMRDPSWSHLRFVRLRSRAEQRQFLSGLRAGSQVASQR
jgi:adenylate kinase family enzyme